MQELFFLFLMEWSFTVCLWGLRNIVFGWLLPIKSKDKNNTVSCFFFSHAQPDLFSTNFNDAIACTVALIQTQTLHFWKNFDHVMVSAVLWFFYVLRPVLSISQVVRTVWSFCDRLCSEHHRENRKLLNRWASLSIFAAGFRRRRTKTTEVNLDTD